MVGSVPIAIATGMYGRGGGRASDFYLYTAYGCFDMSLLNGIMAAGWYGAIFATRRMLKLKPKYAWKNRVAPSCGCANNPTIPEALGLIPLALSAGVGILGIFAYGMHLIERGPVVRSKESAE